MIYVRQRKDLLKQDLAIPCSTRNGLNTCFVQLTEWVWAVALRADEDGYEYMLMDGTDRVFQSIDLDFKDTFKKFEKAKQALIK